MAEWIVEIVDGIPHIKQMIPLVRCKDCKHWKNKHICEAWGRFGTVETKENQFCSYGDEVTE